MDNASNFTRSLPLPATPKGVTKWVFIYVKMAKAKTVSRSTLGSPEYKMVNAINVKCAFTPGSNPKRGNKRCIKQYHVYHWPISE